MDDAIIRCENLVKIYKTQETEVLALQGLELEVARGELMAIIGNSGSGKSTFLNMVGGLDRPSAGRLIVDGQDLFRLSDRELVRYKRSTVGFVWQNSARNLLPYLTAQENVELPMAFERCAGQPMKAVLRAWFPRCPAKRTAALTRRRKAAPTRSARGRRRCASPRRRAMWSWRRWPDGIRIFENSKNIKTERTGRLPRGVRPVRLFLCDRRHAFGAFCLPVTDSISMHQTAV